VNSAGKNVWIIAKKEIHEAFHNRFLLIVTLFMLLASAVALVTAAIALNTDVATYNDAKAVLLSLGKSADMIVQPEFYPLRLLRGFIEHIEILGAVLGVLMGYQAAATERTHKTLPLLLSRPISKRAILFGKTLGATVILMSGLALIFVAIGLLVDVTSSVKLTVSDSFRMGIIYLAAVVYSLLFFLIGFLLALHTKKLPNALLLGFAVWLMLVLIAPQIGDTLDPDNQVAGGVFKQLHIAKPQEVEILKSFATYETVRTSIEALSPTKHFERLSFAVLGIKDMYNGMALSPVLKEKTVDMYWLAGLLAGLLILLMKMNLNFTLLNKE